jgi:hypothetical protein
MDFSIEISSDSDGGEEVPFAVRVARKTFRKKPSNQEKKKSPKRMKISSSAFSDSDCDLPSPPPQASIHDSVAVTPPPAFISPYRPSTKVRISPPVFTLPGIEELLPDTEELEIQ